METAGKEADLLKWHEALRLIAFEECVEKGFLLAEGCDHDEARWLCSLFPTGVQGREEVVKVFLAQGEEKKALFFAGMLWRFREGVGVNEYPNMAPHSAFR